MANRITTRCIRLAGIFLASMAWTAVAWAEQAMEDEGPVAAPAIISPEQWGSDPDPIPENRRHTPAFITIHHAGVLWNAEDDPYQRLRGLQSWGKRDRDWPDVPYHYLIAPDGRIFAGRPVDYEPETNTDYDVRGHVGVQLWGSFGQQRASQQQLASAVHLIAWLCQIHEIDPATIRGHRDVANTNCPGADLSRYITGGLIWSWVEQTLAGNQPQIELLPPLPDGPHEMIPLPAAEQE